MAQKGDAGSQQPGRCLSAHETPRVWPAGDQDKARRGLPGVAAPVSPELVQHRRRRGLGSTYRATGGRVRPSSPTRPATRTTGSCSAEKGASTNTGRVGQFGHRRRGRGHPRGHADDLADLAITAVKIADGAVGNSKLAGDPCTPSLSGAVGDADLADLVADREDQRHGHHLEARR